MQNEFLLNSVQSIVPEISFFFKHTLICDHYENETFASLIYQNTATTAISTLEIVLIRMKKLLNSLHFGSYLIYVYG